MKKANKFEIILSFLSWLKNSDSGVDLCHMHDTKKTPLSEKDKIQIVKQFLNSPERQ